MKRRSKEAQVAVAFHEVNLLLGKFYRGRVPRDVVRRAMLIGAGIAAFDSGLDDFDFEEEALNAHAIAVAIRTGKRTVVEKKTEQEPMSTGLVN